MRRVLLLTGGPEAADDPRFQSNLDRVKHVEEIDAIVGGWIATAIFGAATLGSLIGVVVAVAGAAALVSLVKK